MAKITIKIEPLGGSDITEIFTEAIKLSKKLDVNVEFSANNITCFTTPDGDADTGTKNYHKALTNKYPFTGTK